MTEIASSFAVLLAGVLLWASVVKLRRPSTTAASFAALGLRAPRLLARVVPLGEVTVAALLVTVPWLGGWAAFGLLAVFSAVLVPVVRARRTVGCGCFGAASSAPVGWVTLARNAVLAVAAVLAASVPRVRLGWGGAVAVGSAAVVVTMVFGLVALRREAGALFHMRLPGGSA